MVDSGERGNPKGPVRSRGPKGGTLFSLMTGILTRNLMLVVILLAIPLTAGCSSLFGDPQEQANEAISAANKDISAHNRSFEEARNAYAEARGNIESGDNPDEQTGRIADAGNALGEARDKLQSARESINEVNAIDDVDPAVKRYASLLSEAMDAQLGAESGEIEFYSILEEDPALEDRRDAAEEVLANVTENYEKAEATYAEAREVADKNPEVLGPQPDTEAPDSPSDQGQPEEEEQQGSEEKTA